MRVADVIFQRIKTYTNAVYFIPGGGCMFLVDALGRSGLRAVSTIHEQGAGYMALGHAMVTGKLGVCLITTGPGATNALTACAAAWMDSIPVLFISGQAKTETLIGDTGLRTRGVQEVDIIPMVKHITKKACQPENSAQDCLMTLDAMLSECRLGRPGPCWLSIPLDLQGVEFQL